MRNALAVITLALGVGASTAIFSFVNPLLLHPLNYPNAERLVVITERDSNGRASSASYPAYRDWRTQTSAFSEVGAFDIGFFFLTGIEEAEQVAGALVTPSLFQTLGVAPALGRSFREAEEGVVILSDACWRRRFGGDPNILGKSIALDWARTPEVERYTVIGVMPPKFWMYYRGFEVFVPLGRSSIREDRRARGLIVVGRRSPGVGNEQAQSALASLPVEKDWGVQVQSWSRAVTEPLRTELLVLSGGAALLLLIAAANVAGLLLVRAQVRRREIAIRVALGAKPWRLVAMFLRESLWLGSAAAALGVVFAWCGVHLTLVWRPADLYIMQLSPGLDRIAVDASSLGFAAGAGFFACLLAGLLPALQSRTVDMNKALKDAGSPQSQRTRQFLVTAEVALSVMLLAGAGLMIKTMQRIRELDLGFRPDHLLVMRLPVPRGQASDAVRTGSYFRDVLDRTSELPEVHAAALGEQLPAGGSGDTLPSTGRGPGNFEIPGRPDAIRARINVISPGYLAALGIPLLRGRYLTGQDERKIVISASMAERGWPGGDPIGQTMQRGGQSFEVVGVVANTRNVSANSSGVFFGDNRGAVVYEPIRDATPLAQFFLAVRTTTDPLAASRAVRQVVQDMGGVIAEMDSMDRSLENATWRNEQAAGLLTAFAALAVVLSSVGLYSVISFAVAQRTREIGIRMAIGARPGDVMKVVLVEGGRPVVAGLILGLAGALGMGRLLFSLLYRVAPSDPFVLMAVVLAVSLASLAALAVPVHRALLVDPLIALRTE
jgi:predicted permease